MFSMYSLVVCGHSLVAFSPTFTCYHHFLLEEKASVKQGQADIYVKPQGKQVEQASPSHRKADNEGVEHEKEGDGVVADVCSPSQ
eukprot:758625-Hanusia_phi.AAC.8